MAVYMSRIDYPEKMRYVMEVVSCTLNTSSMSACFASTGPKSANGYISLDALQQYSVITCMLSVTDFY